MLAIEQIARGMIAKGNTDAEFQHWETIDREFTVLLGDDLQNPCCQTTGAAGNHAVLIISGIFIQGQDDGIALDEYLLGTITFDHLVYRGEEITIKVRGRVKAEFGQFLGDFS